MTAVQQQKSQASFNALARNVYYGRTLGGDRQTSVFLYMGCLVEDERIQNPSFGFTDIILDVDLRKMMQNRRLSRYKVKSALSKLVNLGYIKIAQYSPSHTKIQFTSKAIELLDKAWQPAVVERELML